MSKSSSKWQFTKTVLKEGRQKNLPEKNPGQRNLAGNLGRNHGSKLQGTHLLQLVNNSNSSSHIDLPNGHM